MYSKLLLPIIAALVAFSAAAVLADKTKPPATATISTAKSNASHLKFDGVEGGSTHKDHKGEVE
jgi:archaellum component FlaG (FlaF/FlaG flagellin family)